jgi:hypothetical protein
VTDDTAAIQAAINAVGTSGGGTVYLPEGTYKINLALNVAYENVKILGASKRSAVIKQFTTNAKTFNISANYFSAQSFAIRYNSAGTAGGSAFYSTKFYGVWDDIKVDLAHIAWEFAAAANSQMLTNIIAEDSTSSGFFVFDSFNVQVTNFFIINQNAVDYCLLGCIRFYGHVEGCIFSNGELYQGVYSITTDTDSDTVGNRPAYNKFSNVYFDSSYNGALFDKCLEFDIIGCWFSNRPNNGAYLLKTDGLKFIGGGAINCAKSGIYVSADTTNVQFIGFAARGNSTLTSNTYSGITIAANTLQFLVLGCLLGEGAITGFGLQKYGLNIEAGTSNNYNVSNNIASGNGTANIIDGGTGTEKHVCDNFGYKTTSNGVGAILSGTNSVVITHLLDVTPKVQDISFSSASAMGSNPFYIDSTLITSTTFTVKTATNVAGNSFFVWQIRASGA